MRRSEIEIGPKTKERFERIKAKIQEEPQRFVMETYFVDEGVSGLPEWYSEPPCGTTACICGWANLLRMEDEDSALLKRFAEYKEESTLLHLWREAADYNAGLRWLDIEEKFLSELTKVSDVIFHVRNWPGEFALAYRKAKTAQRAVDAACAFIDYICTGPIRQELKVSN